MSAGVRRWALIGLAALAFAGCSKQSVDKPAVLPAEADAARAAPAAAGKDKRRATLATTRNIDLQLEPAAIPPLFNATQAACEADTASACVVMRARLTTGLNPRAELTLRATPAGIAQALQRLRSGHGVVSESAESEDLAAPIVDVERQIAMRREYRDSLLALRAKGGDIKALMSVNEELARVQTELEASSGERAHLQQRIDTETLTIVIATADDEHEQSRRPIARALHEFGGNLAEAAGAAITFIAWVIPWSAVIVPLVWLVRLLWRRWRRPR